MGLVRNIELVKGATYECIVRWETLPILFKAITNITRAAPAVVTSVAHGLKTGWRVAIESVLGMRQINASASPPRHRDYVPITVLTADTFSLDGIDSSLFFPYTSGGFARCATPTSLSGATAQFIFYALDGTQLLVLDSATMTPDITIDATANTITVLLSAAKSAAITWTNATYTLWIANAGVVTLNPVPASMTAIIGAPIRVQKQGNANTGAYTLNVNGNGPLPVVTPGGAGLIAAAGNPAAKEF